MEFGEVKFYEDFEENAIDEEYFEVVCEVEEMKPKHVLSFGARCVLTFGGALSNVRNVCARVSFLPAQLVNLV